MKQKKIFIIDDASEILELTARLLQSKGYAVSAFDDGQKAIPSIEQTRPDLILLDMFLSEENGLDICHQIKSNENTKNIPIIVTTGHHSPQEDHDEKLIPPDDYIIKPFDIDNLVKKIEQWVR